MAKYHIAVLKGHKNGRDYGPNAHSDSIVGRIVSRIVSSKIDNMKNSKQNS